VAQLKVSLPSLPEQREIGNTLRSCDDKVAALEQEIGLLDELFRALLEEFMTGRLSAVPLINSGKNL
jgi:type I restriction enzyme, S subunit